MSLISWISSPLLKSLWATWGIQFLVALGLTCQIVLTLLGSRRKYITWRLFRFVIWATYLLLPNVVTITLGKLTGIRIHNPENPVNNAVLEGLLAPLLLMQLGHPDITTYAPAENRLGLRQAGNIVANVGLVVWVLIRCWDGSPVSWLYLPLLTVGIMKSTLRILALQSVYDKNSSVTAMDTKKRASIQQVFEAFPHEDEKFDSAKDILKAYFRFDYLQPHLVNWPYHPWFISCNWMSIDDSTANHTFSVTEIELDFMFNVLHTNAPILFTKIGLIGHFFGFLCLVSAFCGFAVICKSAFLTDMYITYTYALLMAFTSLQLYQIMTMAFSDWAVVKMCMNLQVPLVRRFLPFVADRCMKQRRWSRSIGQLNLLDRHLLYQDWWKPVGLVLDCLGKREIFRRYSSLSRQNIPSGLKVLLFQKMAELEKKRHFLPFTERGEWTLETHGIQENQTLSDSITMEFDKSIIIWHVTTESLLILERENSHACRGSKLLSDYMIYLLALRPYMLSLPTANITLEHACCSLRHLLRDRDHSKAIIQMLSADGDVPDPMEPSKPMRITHGWHVLLEVQKLVAQLRTMDNKWEIISSIWVEMLCYGAYVCQVYHHTWQLRRGGELITHVWLLLAHKTNKYHLNIDDLPKSLAA